MVKNLRLVILSRKHDLKVCKDFTQISSSLNCLTSEVWLKSGIGKVDVVIHLGAFTPKSHRDADRIDDIYRDNLCGTRTLLESLPVPPERIVFASTIDVYAQPSPGFIINEKSPLGPSGLYGASKLFCEQLIRVYAKTYGCGYSILRFGHIFGPGEGSYEKLVPKLIRGLLQGEPPILFGDGSAERDYLYVDDAVEATLRSAASNINELGPVNIVRGISTQIRNIADLLIGIMEYPEKIQYLRDKSNGYSLQFDNSLMCSSLGGWNFVGLEEGLKREVEYLLEGSEWKMKS